MITKLPKSILILLTIFIPILPKTNRLINNKEILETIFHTKADEFPNEKVIKITFPRNDIKVLINNWPLDPFMGLSSWIAFQQSSKSSIQTMAMGDLVLTEEEVNPVLDTALDNNIKVTALHNHFFFDKPKIYFMHITSEGELKNIALNIKKLFNTIQNVSEKKSTPQLALPSENNINGSLVEQILSVKGQAKDGMFKVVIGRQTKAMPGWIIGKNMGINTWAGFAGNDNNAIVDGDFAVLENELQDVLKSLRSSTINIVAIHNHMIHENPRLIFIHYWGQGTLHNLASGLKNALEHIKK